MSSLTELMEAARAKSIIAASPGAHAPPQPTRSPAPEIPRPHVIAGATQCPVCRSTWIIESYGPDGRTLCYSCRSPRPATFDYDEPAITAGASCAPGQLSTLTAAQFIDAVTKAGYPKLAELAMKYDKTITKPQDNEAASVPAVHSRQ